jgi:hypothetical protein
MSRSRRAGRALLRVLAAVLLVVAGLGVPAPAAAALLPCEVLQVEALDAGSRRVELRCDLDERGVRGDLVTIFSRGPAAGAAAAWPDAADTEDATWIFDYGGDGFAELVMRFGRDGGAAVAELFDGRGNPRWLDYAVSGPDITLRNDPPATVRVVAQDGWWQRDNLVNFNLDIYVDGLLDAAFDMRSKLRGHVDTDGIVDFTIRIADETGNGRPDYDWRTVRHPPSQPRALQLSYLTVNERGNEPPLEPMWPWPYFGPLTYGYLTAGRHDTSQPPIQMDWETGTLTAVGEFVSSRGNDAQWFIYSNEVLGPGLPNRPNFENPFAWYDLAGDRDGQPELAIRLVYYDQNDPIFVRGNYSSPMNVVRYSWDQTNDDHWDYKLGLLGSYPITTTVRAAGMEIATVPYDDFPRWVLDKSWPIATFVAAEGVRARGEGIYVWDPSAWLTERYYTGFTDTPWPPDDVLADRAEDQHDLGNIPVGYRGEYHLNLGEQVRLYVSPVDHKLHLRGASHGTWNIDETSELQYADRSGDGYLDEWRYLVDGTLEQQLNVAGPHLVFTTPDEVVVRQVTMPAPIWEGEPPADTASWETLGAVLEPFLPDLGLPPRERLLAQIDLRRMLDRFEGPTAEIRSASLRDIRPDGEGARFVLDLANGFRASGPDLLGIEGRPPGSYVVSYDAGFFTRPSSPAAIGLTLAVPEEAGLVASLPVPIQVRTSNSGLEDAVGLVLVAEASRGQQRVVFADQPVDVLAGQTQEFRLTWPGGAPGEWQVDVRLEDEAKRAVAAVTEHVTLVAGRSADAGAVAVASTSSGWHLPAFALLVGVAVLAGLAVREANRTPRPRGRP